MINLNKFKLREEYQLPIHNATLEHLRTKDAKPAFIDASVGAGKTLNIAAIAKHTQEKGGRVLILARQGELVKQNSEMAWKCGLKNSIYSASCGSKSTFYPVVFGTEGTIAGALDGDFATTKYDLLLIDECHHVDHQDTTLSIKNNSRKRTTKQSDDSCITQTEPTQYTKIIMHLLKLNPKLRIIGYTGSPYRGKETIIGDFWQKKLYEVPTMYLVSLGYLVPPVFGFGDDAHKYDLAEWTPKDADKGASDYGAKELQAMQRKITKDKQLTQIIMEEVVGICEARSGGVMITCAGKKHCEQVAEFLPEDSWAIIVDSTSTKARSQSLTDVRTGKIKYILQIGCLTTGINIPPLSTSVILRRIGSLTLLTQLIGRILRTLEDEDLERGFTKIDGLVLDYTDTFESFGDIYDDPMLDNARAAKGKFISETQDCPTCNAVNSIHAVRCIGAATNSDGRCDYYFKGSMCLRCDTMNAPTARTCRNCDAIMIDPAKALKNKAYTDANWKEVVFGSMSMKPTANKDGVCVEYSLNSIYTVHGKEMQEVAREYLKPFSTAPHERQKWQSFVSTHINGRGFQAIMRKNTTINDIIKNKAMFCMPSHITHRVNDKGFSIINRRRFLSGREEG